ncbi:MAG: PEP-CTERM sorting domain-containing protein [Cyanobacteria bacterium P01_H01_bin.162]
MKNLIAKAAIAATLSAASFSVAAAANAGTLHKQIHFEGSSHKTEYFKSLFQDLGNGLTLTVTAGSHSGSSSANAPLNGIKQEWVTQVGGSEPGLGVWSQWGDSNQLDAYGPNEFLRFTFNKEVTLKHAIFESAKDTFNYWGRVVKSDEFDLGVDGTDLHINDTFGTDNLTDFPGAGFWGSTDRQVDFSGGADFAGDGTNALKPIVGTVFDFYTTDKNDSYRIRKMKVAVDVPEPATMLGLGVVAAAGLLAQKRSRKETA